MEIRSLFKEIHNFMKNFVRKIMHLNAELSSHLFMGMDPHFIADRDVKIHLPEILL